jgi:hypothetical protein
MNGVLSTLQDYGLVVKLYMKILMYAAIAAALIALIVLVAKLID